MGLLGGMSWESSAEYYRLVNQGVKERLGGLHSARCLLYSVDFAEIEALQMSGDWQRAAEILGAAAAGLERAGADFLVLCTNTMHKLADPLSAGLNIPLLHIGDATVAAIRARGLNRVGLLGTRFTMEQDFYRERLTGQGIQVLVPKRDDRQQVDRIIYEELCQGLCEPASRTVYREVIARLVDQGAEGIVLGCTEIGLLVGAGDSPVTLFDTTAIHAAAAVDMALGAPGT